MTISTLKNQEAHETHSHLPFRSISTKIADAIVLYCDLRSFIAEQAEAQEKTIRVLSEMSVRLQTIEHRMEVLHMQPPPAPKKEE